MKKKKWLYVLYMRDACRNFIAGRKKVVYFLLMCGRGNRERKKSATSECCRTRFSKGCESPVCVFFIYALEIFRLFSRSARDNK